MIPPHWHIFPVDIQKRPLTKNGHLDALPKEQALATWWNDSQFRSDTGLPESGWAVSCAASGLLVVDVDPRNGGLETIERLQAEHGPFPETLAALTGGMGVHLYFRKPEGDKFRKTLGPGVDIKCQGYVVLPPSPHASGMKYAWHNPGADIVDLPEWALAMVLPFTPDDQYEPIGEAGTCFLARAFDAAGMLGREIDALRVCVRCPWEDAHSNAGSDTSTIIFAPTADTPLGRFYCSHTSHGPKGLGEVVDMLPAEALAGAI